MRTKSNCLQIDECYKNCEKTKLGCKTRLVKSNIKSESGVYKLNEGILNFTCLFESLPGVVNIKWKFKKSPNVLNYSPGNIHEINNDREVYKNIKCDQLKYSHDCSGNTEGHLSFSNCLLEVRDIRMTGYYKCEAVDSLTGQILSTGIETKVRVIGLQSIDVVKSRLVPFKSGYVQIKVCANSYPFITWILKDTILQPTESKYHYSSSKMSNVPFYNIDDKENLSFQNIKNISLSDPFCYYVQLFINNVNKDIEDLHVGVTNDIVKKFRKKISFINYYKQKMSAPIDPTALKVAAATNIPQTAEGQKRTANGKFTLAQLRQTDAIVPLQYGTNQFDSQRGMTGFGTPRDVKGKHLKRIWELEFPDEAIPDDQKLNHQQQQ
uniref:Ig-like domain-containing protein n=1 Tax=Strongyloides stercoralis TaxID=6248 RepID=A0A0K0DVK3_STRER